MMHVIALTLTRLSAGFNRLWKPETKSVMWNKDNTVLFNIAGEAAITTVWPLIDLRQMQRKATLTKEWDKRKDDFHCGSSFLERGAGRAFQGRKVPDLRFKMWNTWGALRRPSSLSCTHYSFHAALVNSVSLWLSKALNPAVTFLLFEFIMWSFECVRMCHSFRESD